MKFFLKLLTATTIVFNLNLCFAQNPTYILRAENFENPAPNIMDFEIYLEHTNPPVPLKFFAVQLAFNIDTLIANGGRLSVSVAPANTGDSSGLPRDMMIKPPQLIKDDNGITYIITTSKISANPDGLDLTNNGSPGTRIAKIRIETSADKLSQLNSGLEWRNKGVNNTMVVVFNGNLVNDVSTPDTHLLLQTQK